MNNINTRRQTVAELYTHDQFEALLSSAEFGAVKPKDCEFVDDMRAKFSAWGTKAFLSDAQHDWLKTIAKG